MAMACDCPRGQGYTIFSKEGECPHMQKSIKGGCIKCIKDRIKFPERFGTRNYKLTNETLIINKHILHRIVAVRYIPGVNISAGSVGGWIENELNLSNGGGCWVYKNAKVYGDARVWDSAQVYGESIVMEKAIISDDARIFGSCVVRGKSRIYGNARVSDHAKVSGNVRIFDNAQVRGNSRVFGNAMIFESAIMSENAVACENSRLSGVSWVHGNAKICGRATIAFNTQMTGGTWNTSPLYIKGSRNSVNICSPTKIRIGSDVLDLTGWKKLGLLIAKENKYTPKEIKEYTEYIKLIKKLYFTKDKA